MNEDRPASSARELLSTESTFQRCIDYVDIATRSINGGRFSELPLRFIYQGCRALTFALARLSCLPQCSACNIFSYFVVYVFFAISVIYCAALVTE